MDVSRFLAPADAYKEIHARLFELVSGRVGRIAPGVFEGKTTAVLIYMRGVAEA